MLMGWIMMAASILHDDTAIMKVTCTGLRTAGTASIEVILSWVFATFTLRCIHARAARAGHEQHQHGRKSS